MTPAGFIKPAGSSNGVSSGEQRVCYTGGFSDGDFRGTAKSVTPAVRWISGLFGRDQRAGRLQVGGPALSLELNFLSRIGNKVTSLFGRGHVTYELHIFQTDYLVVVGKRYGEEQFVIFSSVKGACEYVHVQIFGHDCGLVVNGDALLIDAAPGITLFTYMYEFR